MLTEVLDQKISIKENGRNLRISKKLAMIMQLVNKAVKGDNLLYSVKAKSISDIQKLENFNDGSYIAEILKLKFLAPDIIESILNGKQPINLNIKKLRRIKTLDWEEQRKFINA